MADHLSTLYAHFPPKLVLSSLVGQAVSFAIDAQHTEDETTRFKLFVA